MMQRVHPPDAGDESLGKHQEPDIYCTWYCLPSAYGYRMVDTQQVRKPG